MRELVDICGADLELTLNQACYLSVPFAFKTGLVCTTKQTTTQVNKYVIKIHQTLTFYSDNIFTGRITNYNVT